MKNTTLTFMLLLFSFQVFAQKLLPKEILFKANEAIQNLAEFECDFNYTLMHDGSFDKGIKEKGRCYYKRVPSDTVLGGKLRLETNSYSILYNLDHALYLHHPIKKLKILNLHKIEERHYPIGLEIVAPLELMHKGLEYYPNDPNASFSISEETADTWEVKISRKIDNVGSKEWSKYYLVKKKEFLIENIKLVLNNYGQVNIQEWKLENIQTNIGNPGERLEHFTLPMNYKISYQPLIIQGDFNDDKYLPVGTPVPDFSFPDLGGNNFALSDHKDKLVLLDFWEYWCGPCIKSIPKLKRLHERYSDQGFVILGIFLERKDIVERISEENEILYPNLQVDKAFLKLFRINRWPTAVLIKNGVVVYAGSANGDELETQIKKHL